MTGHAPENDAALPDASDPHRSHHVTLIGGQYGGRKVGLAGAPQHIDVGGLLYERLDDPDTGDYLGGYVFSPGDPR